jgi:hypothetical protein
MAFAAPKDRGVEFAFFSTIHVSRSQNFNTCTGILNSVRTANAGVGIRLAALRLWPHRFVRRSVADRRCF